MFFKMLVHGFRNLQRNKLFTIINLLGLSIGLASFILIMLYVTDELKYDRYHTNSNRIFRVLSFIEYEGVSEKSSSCPYPVGPTLKAEYPHLIQQSCRVYNNWSENYLFVINNKSFIEKRMFFADSTIFEVFDFRFLHGNPASAFNSPKTIILTESTARKYFGTEYPMGKVIMFEGKVPLTVTGIVADPPQQTHFHFNALASMSTAVSASNDKMMQNWIWNPFWTYVLLKTPEDAKRLEAQLPAFVKKYYSVGNRDHASMSLQPLTDIHLKSSLDYEIEANGKIIYIRILSGIALFLLLIACINYMNISTALSTGRAKEIAVKKVVGFFRPQLIVQLLTESLILSLIALFIALAVVELCLPYFNSLSSKSLESGWLLHSYNFLWVILAVLLTGLLSGAYPAFVLSTYNPVKVIKGNHGKGARNHLPRRILVIIQFSISLILIIFTLTAFRQLRFMQDSDTGFTRDNILVLPVRYTGINRHFEAFRNEISAHSAVVSVTAADYILGTDHNSHEFRTENTPKDRWQYFPALMVRKDFIKTFGIKIIAGRDYNDNLELEAMESILINESMAKKLAGSPSAAIGKQFNSLSGKEKVVGVFADFHVKSMHNSISPMVLNIKEEQWEQDYYTNYVFIRYRENSLEGLLPYIEQTWDTYTNKRPFEYFLLRDKISSLYREEDTLGKLSALLTFMTIFVAGMGLLGMAVFMASQRQREIAIRKVAGASVFEITILLSIEFGKVVLFSLIISWIVSWFVVKNWLNHFAYRISPEPLSFLYSGGLILLYAAVITGIIALYYAGKKPAEVLKYE